MTRRTDGPFVVYEILPGRLYQRGKLHSLEPAKKLSGLRHYGITTAVALAPPTPDPYLSVFFDYIHQPIPDGALDPKTGGLKMLVLASQLVHNIEFGGTVLTMCNAGRNRSGLLSALIVRELTGLPGSAAMKVVRQHRPNAIANPNFERFLEGLS